MNTEKNGNKTTKGKITYIKGNQATVAHDDGELHTYHIKDLKKLDKGE